MSSNYVPCKCLTCISKCSRCFCQVQIDDLSYQRPSSLEFVNFFYCECNTFSFPFFSKCPPARSRTSMDIPIQRRFSCHRIPPRSYVAEFCRAHMSSNTTAHPSASVVHSVTWAVPDSSCQCPPLHYHHVPLDIAPWIPSFWFPWLTCHHSARAVQMLSNTRLYRDQYTYFSENGAWRRQVVHTGLFFKTKSVKAPMR